MLIIAFLASAMLCLASTVAIFNDKQPNTLTRITAKIITFLLFALPFVYLLTEVLSQ